MRYAPKGNWFVRVTNTQTGKSGYLLYDGFKTKREALEFIDKLNNTQPHRDGTMVATLEKRKEK